MIAAVVVALWALAAPLQPGSDAFFLTLQRAVERGDRQAVAAMLAYPLNVTAAGVRLPIRDEAALLAHYDAIFTADLKAVLSTSVRERFITHAIVDGAIKITEIRVPVGPPTTIDITPHPPAPSGPAPVAPRAAPRVPERIVFRAGGGSGQLAGALGRGQTASYVLRAAKGQLLTVRIERVRARAVVARIADSRSGAPLDARAAEGVRSWTGRVPADGDYRIDVVRLLQDTTPAIPYTLVVSLR